MVGNDDGPMMMEERGMEETSGLLVATRKQQQSDGAHESYKKVCEPRRAS